VPQTKQEHDNRPSMDLSMYAYNVLYEPMFVDVCAIGACSLASWVSVEQQLVRRVVLADPLGKGCPPPGLQLRAVDAACSVRLCMHVQGTQEGGISHRGQRPA
jgi:hypothetical protein